MFWRLCGVCVCHACLQHSKVRSHARSGPRAQQRPSLEPPCCALVQWSRRDQPTGQSWVHHSTPMGWRGTATVKNVFTFVRMYHVKITPLFLNSATLRSYLHILSSLFFCVYCFRRYTLLPVSAPLPPPRALFLFLSCTPPPQGGGSRQLGVDGRGRAVPRVSVQQRAGGV